MAEVNSSRSHDRFGWYLTYVSPCYITSKQSSDKRLEPVC